MALYRVLEPLSYIKGNTIIEVTRSGMIIELTDGQAAPLFGKLSYAGSLDELPEARLLYYDSSSDFPTVGDAGTVYLDQGTGKFYRYDFELTQYIFIGRSDNLLIEQFVDVEPFMAALMQSASDAAEARDTLGTLSSAEIEDLVVETVADDGTVTDAAAAAATSAVADVVDSYSGVLPQATDGDPYPLVIKDQAGLVSLFTDSEGHTWLRLHDDTIFPSFHPTLSSDDTYAFVVADSVGNVSELCVNYDGRLPQWVCDSIVTRGVPPTLSARQYTLKLDGSGDYTTLADAIADLGDGTESEPIELIIYPGTHECYQDVIPDWWILRGTNKLLCRLHGENPDDAVDLAITNNSTLQFEKNHELHNLTVTCRNMRYAIHDESGGGSTDGTITVQNCHLEHYGNQAARDWRTANPGSGLSPSTVWHSEVPYGYGTSSGNIRRFVDTTFIGGYHPWNVHDNANFSAPSQHDLENCEIGTYEQESYILVQSLGSGQWSRLSMRGCSAGVLAVMYGDIPYISIADDQQLAQHVQFDVRIDGLDPIGMTTWHRGKALKIESASTSAPSTVRVSGTGADAIFGESTHRDGGGGLKGYIYGQWDISGILCGILSNTTTKNTLGRRLGDCSSVNKTLTVTVDGGTPVDIVFSTDLTATSNSTIISTINTALGSAATASEYLVTSGETYPDFTSRTQLMANRSSSVGIPRWSAVKRMGTRGVQIMETTDAATLFYGVALEPMAPGAMGRILTSGRLLTTSSSTITGIAATEGSQMAGLNSNMSAGSTVYHSDTVNGEFSTTGTRVAATVDFAKWATFKGNS
jgi:hypothetical protein